MSGHLDGERTVSDVAKGKKPWFTPARKAGATGLASCYVRPGRGFARSGAGTEIVASDLQKPTAAGSEPRTERNGAQAAQPPERSGAE